jgi:hypothetical protein
MNLMIDFSHFFPKALQIKFSFFYSFEDRFVAFSTFFYILGTGKGSQLARSDGKDQ